jgi:hypothetical protein
MKYLEETIQWSSSQCMLIKDPHPVRSVDEIGKRSASTAAPKHPTRFGWSARVPSEKRRFAYREQEYALFDVLDGESKMSFGVGVEIGVGWLMRLISRSVMCVMTRDWGWVRGGNRSRARGISPLPHQPRIDPPESSPPLFSHQIHSLSHQSPPRATKQTPQSSTSFIRIHLFPLSIPRPSLDFHSPKIHFCHPL